jgi:Mn2+/Fe2+ NRAMP family transporter
MLFWSAVLNGLLAPPLIVLVLLLTSSSDVMGARVNGPILKWLGWITAAAMGFCAVTLIALWITGAA